MTAPHRHISDPVSINEYSDEKASLTWAEHPENPVNWPEKRKWLIFLSLLSTSLLVGLVATSIATPGEEIANEFHVSHDGFPNDYWPVGAWAIGAALGPMVFIPFLETFGIRTGYLVSIGFAKRRRGKLLMVLITDLLHPVPHTLDPFWRGSKFCDSDRNSDS